MSSRPRTKSNFSFRSNKSKENRHSLVHHEPKETHDEKEKNKLHSKADPTLAINEAQPSDVAAADGRLSSLRSTAFKDGNGNVIVEADRSNPTRNRWERPLDTIRSFEAAVDTSNRKLGRNDSNDALSSLGGRRSVSYQGGQFGGRGTGRPDSFIESSAGPTGYGRARPPQRMSADPAYGRGFNGGYGGYGGTYHNGYGGGHPHAYNNGYANNYPDHYGGAPQAYNGNQAYPQGYDSQSASGSGSQNTDPWGNSTAPSSENSSVDRMHHLSQKPDQGDPYGYSGFNGGGHHAQNGNEMGYYEQGHPNGAYPYADPNENRAPPPPPHVPPKDDMSPPAQRTPIKLGNSAADIGTYDPPSASTGTTGKSDKRKSFFKRFSKAQ